MLISKISQTMQGELRKVDGSARAKATEKERPAAKVGDRVEFSASGKVQSSTKGEMEVISSVIRAQPEVRAEKVAEAQAKIASGFYNTGSFAEALADKLARTVA